MRKFKYKALDFRGKSISGVLNANSKDDVYSILQSRQLSAYKIDTVKELKKPLIFRKGVTHKNLARHLRQLTILLDAGVSLLEAFASLSKSNAHPVLASASININKDLRTGIRFSTALENHMPNLPAYVPRLAELGEATGQMSSAMTDAVERMEFEEEMRQEIRTALSYPVFLSVVGSIIILLMFIFVVPRFGNLIGSNTENLPTLSRWVINAGLTLNQHLVVIFFGGALGILSFFLGIKKLNYKDKSRAFLEKLPMIGKVLIRSDLGGWCRTVGIALANGADLLKALRLGEYGLASPRLRSAFSTIYSDIRAGKNIDEVLALTIPEFDPLTIDLIRTGRASGKLENILLFVGNTKQSETREMAKRLSALAEPIAILLIAMIVGAIVISIVMAMTSLYSAI